MFTFSIFFFVFVKAVDGIREYVVLVGRSLIGSLK